MANKNLGAKFPPEIIEIIGELADEKTQNNPDGCKVTKSDLVRKWISEGLEKELKKNNLSAEVPA